HREQRIMKTPLLTKWLSLRHRGTGGKLRSRRGRGWHLEQLEDRVLPAVLDLTTMGASGVLNDAIFSQFAPPAGGSGTINTFVKLSTNQAVEQGYNTDFRPVQFNEVNTTSFTHALRLGSVPTGIAGGGQVFSEFLMGINTTTKPHGLLH